MKKILLIKLLILFAIGSIAQTKIGYVNSQELLLQDSDFKNAQVEVQEYAKSMEEQIAKMAGEYQTKVQEYIADSSGLSLIDKEDRIMAISDLEQRIQSYQQNAQNRLQEKEQMVLEPIQIKIRNAIDEVAKEGGYTYILDEAAGTILYAIPSNNVTSLVKKRLGL